MAGEKIIVEPKIENIPAISPESKPEVPAAAQEARLVSTEKVEAKALPQAKVGEADISPAAKAISYKQKRILEIDSILSAGLNEVFLKMDPAKQKEFKERGEETAIKIGELLDRTKVKISKIIDLIKRWLKLIPGVNKFFLEQEAKIKADRIIKIKDKF
jgi:hypothetical protein